MYRLGGRHHSGPLLQAAGVAARHRFPYLTHRFDEEGTRGPEGATERNTIRVTTRLASGRVAIDVSDTGSGISPEGLRRLFAPFYTTKPVGVGTGLGLSICQRLVTAMGGTIGMTSEVGRGSVFRVCLPQAAQDTPTQMQATVAAAPALR